MLYAFGKGVIMQNKRGGFVGKMREEVMRSLERRAKIICTLGPATNSYEQIYALAEAGMDVARLNFSHGTYESHQKIYDIIRNVSKDIDHPIGIIQDLQGPKIRVGTFEAGEVTLKEGDELILTTDEIEGTQRKVSVSYKNLYNDVKVGEPILLDDGEIKLIAERIVKKNIHCRVIYGGVLKAHKGVNLPGSSLQLKAMTEKDEEDLEFGIRLGVDYVALSFVQTPEDVAELRKKIHKLGGDTPIIAKIEKPTAVDNIQGIADLSDGIMIARGDLGVEMNPEEVPPIQKELIRYCNQNAIPVITATQMLDSMVDDPRPTRAEASDVANAVLDGTDAVMLSAETSIGKYPVIAVQTMARIISLIERKGTLRKDLRKTKSAKTYSPPFAIGCSTYYASELVDASCILCFTQSGSTARIISRFRPNKRIFGLTPSRDTLNRMSLFWGVKGLLVNEGWKNNIDEAIQHLLNFLKEKNIIDPGEVVVITAGLPFIKKRNTNMLRIEEVE
jgi:pyruvate kinase